jgi:hypothetical protein
LRACGDRFQCSNHHRKGRRAWDGSLMTASTRGGPLVSQRIPSSTRCRTKESQAGAEHVLVGGRAVCGNGTLTRPMLIPGGGRDKICLDSVANASRKIEDAIHDEWRAHLPLRDPVAAAALAAVEAAARENEQASERLNSAVADARAAGASWAKVGETAGCSRQSAYKRWAEPNTAGPADNKSDRFLTTSPGQPAPLHLVGTKRRP